MYYGALCLLYLIYLPMHYIIVLTFVNDYQTLPQVFQLANLAGTLTTTDMSYHSTYPAVPSSGGSVWSSATASLTAKLRVLYTASLNIKVAHHWQLTSDLFFSQLSMTKLCS